MTDFREGADVEIVPETDLMKLILIRYSSGEDSTLGLLYKSHPASSNFEAPTFEFLCYTIEDEYRTKKILGETRIPSGTYDIKLRKEGGFHQRYSEKYPEIHKGMLHLQDVPNFKYVLLHIGNNDDDTEGCILVGNSACENITEDGFVGNSTAAYKRVYPPIAAVLERGGTVQLSIQDLA